VTPSLTIHLALVRLMRPIVGDDGVPWSIARDDPDLRRSALYIINGAWCVFAFGSAVAMLVVGMPGAGAGW
jgi:hypothetical protein